MLGSHSHLRLRNGEPVQILLLDGSGASRAVVAVVPLSREGFDRIEAVARLLASLHGQAIPPDSRLTRQQLRRARLMLQAVDGRAAGASYRQIAEVLFGARALDSEPWKTSSRRFATMGLVRNGLALVAGGYRQLLSHRRRR